MADGHIQGISRLDFPLFVNDKVQWEDTGAPSVYKLDLIRTLIQRAWSQTIDEVSITSEAFAYAKAQCDKWDSIYDQDEIPLFTGQEKSESLIRVATAVANLVFSHTTDDETLRTVEVREVHVKWACEWMEHCWHEAKYDQHSDSVRRRNLVTNVLQVTALMTADLESHMVEGSLSCLLHEQELREVITLMPGNDYREQQAMFSLFRRCNVLQAYRDHGRSMVGPTKGGEGLIRRIIDLANDNEDLYDKARQQWSAWKPNDVTTSTPPDFSDESEYEMFLSNEGMW